MSKHVEDLTDKELDHWVHQARAVDLHDHILFGTPETTMSWFRGARVQELAEIKEQGRPRAVSKVREIFGGTVAGELIPGMQQLGRTLV